MLVRCSISQVFYNSTTVTIDLVNVIMKIAVFCHSRATIIRTSKFRTVDNPDSSQAGKIHLKRRKMLHPIVTKRILQHVSGSISTDAARGSENDRYLGATNR